MSPRAIRLDCLWIVKKGAGPYGFPAYHRTRRLWMTKGEKVRDQMVPACHRACRLWMTKGVEDDVSLCVPFDATVSEWRKSVRNDHNLSPHVIRPAASGLQKAQKTMLVSACHRTRLCLNGRKVCEMTKICLRMSSGLPPLDDKRRRR